MGLSVDAHLIWGIPVRSHDEYGDATAWWDEERDDWRSFPDTGLEIVAYGHYNDPDTERGILTSTRVKDYEGDCWSPMNIEPNDLATTSNHDKLYSKANDAARCLGLDVDFYVSASWWLVAGYG